MSELDPELARDLAEYGKFLSELDGLGFPSVAPRPRAASVASNVRLAPSPPPVVETEPELDLPRGSDDEARWSFEGEPALAVSSQSSAVIPMTSTEIPNIPLKPRDYDQNATRLQAIRDDIGDCKRCRLSQGRTNIVFGQGNPAAELMFVGEAPGADEDIQGLAFVGRAGQLLTDMIEKGMKMKREDVFIANVIKCRPPGNRKPETDEVLQCQPFLEAQIRAIQPRILVALGAVPGQWLTKSATPISRLRGRFTSWEGIAVMPTYHPAYLLRNPAAKKDVWADLKLVLAALGK